MGKAQGMAQAVGLLELAGIPLGYLIANEVSKNTVVDLYLADPVCPGSFLLIIAGDAANVAIAMEVAKRLGKDHILSQGMLASIDAAVLRALASPRGFSGDKALGIVETSGIAPGILAADGAVKTAQVELMELRIAGGMGGKALVCFAGEIDAVQMALDHIQELVEPSVLISSILLSLPHPELLNHWQ